MEKLTTLILKIPRNTEVTPEAAQNFLAALTQVNSISFLQKLTGTEPRALALEIALINQQIRFQITCDSELVPFVQTQIQSNYPLVVIGKDKEGLNFKNLELTKLQLTGGSYYPIATYESFTDIDPLSSVLSVLSKSTPDDVALVQYALEATSSRWQTNGANYASRGTKNEDGTYSPRKDESVIKEKISYSGFKVSIRLAANTNKTLREMASSFGVFARADGNKFSGKSIGRMKLKKETNAFLKRYVTDNQILNTQELATIWHLPSEKIKTSSIIWGTKVLSEPPENLPAAIDLTDEQKKNINFFARTQFKNREAVFGLKTADRRRHVWALGKTGTGKSTLIANMAIDDFKKNRGVAVIDPHGDLCDDLLNYIPRSRINDTIYFNPADREYPISINPLEVKNKEEGELVASGLMSIFTKVWANVWSARMEYILRNSFLTLTQIPGSTLQDVLKLLGSSNFRERALSKIDDPALEHFWTQEFDKMPDRLQKEAISPIQNKVGQFVTSPMIRSIIGQSKSSIAIDEMMNDGKIFLVNLSQGKLGEDNAALLGATLITKMQIAAMRRVDIPEAQRKDYFVYVDEFQNFATTSFVKILSEARKYRLSLMLANQYMAQIPEEVQKAILGNAGTIISFSAGAEDAAILHKEFAEVFSENDMVNLNNFQIATKLMVDGHSTRPFLAHTLPLPSSANKNRNKVIDSSRQRYAKKHQPQQRRKPFGNTQKSHHHKPRTQQPKQNPILQKSNTPGKTS